jgi:GNAT superfamily N-acetyltransferase
MTRRQRNNWITQLETEEPIRCDEQRIGALADEGREGRIGIALAADLEDAEPQPECIRRNLQVSDLGFCTRCRRVWVHEHSDRHGLGKELMQQLQLP